MRTATRARTPWRVPEPSSIRDRYVIGTGARANSRPRCGVSGRRRRGGSEAPREGRATIWLAEDGNRTKVATYLRNASVRLVFEPFRQLNKDGWHDYALISTLDSGITVLDLESGDVVARESGGTTDSAVGRWGFGYAPVEYFVPDWWDVHDGSVLPGNPLWSDATDSSPRGTHGFVAGCAWGDTSSWKIHHLDLSRISDGILGRDDRFGYLEIPPDARLKDRVRFHVDTPERVRIDVTLTFELATGEVGAWNLDQLVDPTWRQYRRPDEARVGTRGELRAT